MKFRIIWNTHRSFTNIWPVLIQKKWMYFWITIDGAVTPEQADEILEHFKNPVIKSE